MLLKLECVKELPGELVRRPDLIPEVWGGTQGSAFLTSPQVMSILLPHGRILNITAWPQPSISQALHLFPEFTAG